MIRLVAKQPDLHREIGNFLIDRRARGLSAHTITFYRHELATFSNYIRSDTLPTTAITAGHIRAYLVDLATHRTPGGIGCAYRALKAFWNWYEAELEPADWHNPMAKVHAPKLPSTPLDPVSIADIQRMIALCPRRTAHGERDHAVLLCLLDSGCRASEFISLNAGDVNLADGSIMVRCGKGGKPRSVFLGAKSRVQLARYLRFRPDIRPSDALWTAHDRGRLTYAGLREIVRRLATKAGIPEPGLHSFRRAFALACLRNGVDLVSLQRLMGHTDLTVLRRYLAQNTDDLADAHRRGGPVDCLL